MRRQRHKRMFLEGEQGHLKADGAMGIVCKETSSETMPILQLLAGNYYPTGAKRDAAAKLAADEIKTKRAASKLLEPGGV